MFKARKRLISILIATTIAIGAGVTASGIAGMTADDPTANENEIQQPVPEALMPPIAPWSAPFRM